MKLEPHGKVTLLRIDTGRGNAIGTELLTGLVRLFDEAEQDGARGLVMMGYDRFFSAGLDLPALVEYDRAGMERFMRLFADAMLRFFTCPLPVVAAVNGHAIAGGCVIALQADRRVMGDGPYRIGLNEVQLGLGLPSEVVETARAQLSAASLSKILLTGPLLAPRDALALGLVDEVVPTDELEARALALADEMAAPVGFGFRQLKAALRRPAVEEARRHQDASIAIWLDTRFADATRERILAAVARLKR